MSKYIVLFCVSLSLLTNTIYTQISQQWVSRFSHLSSADDFAKFVDIDNARNIYTAGISDYKFVVMKNNQYGDIVWKREYKTDEVDEDNFLSGLKIDANKNVYLTSSVYGSDTTYDILTIKYNSSGVLQWAVTYQGSGATDDIAVGLAVDASGNVYVAGYNYNPLTGNDFILVKYNSNGTQQWMRKVNGASNDDDIPVAITIDNLQNIYITGSTYNYETFIDYLTVKFDSTGLAIWTVTYDDGLYDEDIPVSINLDNFNNIYVTGSTYGDTSDLDIAVVKYNPTGKLIQVSKYNSPFNSDDIPVAVKVAGGGTIYVTGYTDGFYSWYDYLTLKFNSNGSLAWSAIENGDANNDDMPVAVTLDASENVYVTGSQTQSNGFIQINTIKYSNSGVKQWMMPYSSNPNDNTEPVGILLDPIGNLTVVGTCFSVSNANDILMLRYTTSGVLSWIKKENGISEDSYDDYPMDMAIDNLGNAYIAGASYDNGTSFDYVTIKYNSDGNVVWNARYDGITNNNDEAVTVKVDALKNVYVTGTSFEGAESENIVTIKYNQNGVVQWIKSFNGIGNGIDRAVDLTLDNAANVYVTGYSMNVSGHYDFITIKYNTSGNQDWVSYFNSSSGMNDFPSKIRVDNSGNVYVTGYCSTIASMNNYVTVKYNSSGVQQWVNYYDGTAGNDDMANALGLDGSGNVYVTGSSVGVGSQTDMVTIKYNPAGSQLWEIRYNGSGNGMDYPKSISVNAMGEVIVGGWSFGSGTFADAVILKYNANGNLIWEKRYNGAFNDYDYLEDMLVDSYGNVYATCTSSANAQANNFIVMKYNPSGVQQWIAFYNNSSNPSDEVGCVRLDSLGNLFITGTTYDSLDCSDILTLKYRQSTFVSGRVFFDMNNNGINDDNEPPLVGWMVRLNGVKKDSILTDTEGRYYFADIPFGSYALSQLIKPGWLQTLPGGGAASSFSIGLGTLSYVSEFGNYSSSAYSYNIDDRWNIASVPLRSSDLRRSIIFSSAVSNAFSFQNGYVAKDTLEILRGYWLKFTTAHNLWIAGTSFRHDTVNVQTGWNLIGAVSVPVATSSVTTIPPGIIQSSFYGYKAGYSISDTLKPAKGYWVKVTQNGKMIIGNTTPIANSSDTELTTMNKLGKLIITDNENNSTTLYFGNKTEVDILDKYLLPPVPPAGVFDARFAGDNLLFVPLTDLTQETSILLSGASFPVNISWEVTDSLGDNFELSNHINARMVYLLKGSGNITLQSEEDSDLIMRFVQTGVSEIIPQNFALEQNYPNPFNPTTTIKYDIPVENFVILKIFNTLGQEVATLVNEMQAPGFKAVKWDASNLPSGIYIYRLTAGKFTDVKKLMLIK
jgi:uncharacterized delta-60 repeat protein